MRTQSPAWVTLKAIGSSRPPGGCVTRPNRVGMLNQLTILITGWRNECEVSCDVARALLARFSIYR